MPKSRVRTKAAYTPPPTRSVKKRVSAPWVGPLMLGCFLVGIVWLVLFYVTGGSLPIKSIANWNLLVGFGFIIAGFVTSTQWR
ncbi:MAG TPA: cell division protein CrgA [Mycobacteriales bacterium]|nr:cell division protein CrgA [Mycobacteriales bacterium]